ncbi:MAG TPA: ATP-binding protein [Anaerolineales bacterium]|nr:ATP-binding protein [Anaerolineales bacterium]
MSESSQPNFRNTELDPQLLSAPFNVKTNWCVITGAPCSGKTTIIDMLAEKGFQTVQEAGREYFEGEFAKGRTIEEIRKDQAVLTRQVYDIMVEHENGLRAHEINFLDRALPDGFAFYRLAGMNPNEILPDCFQHRYTAVFLLNRLPYQKDGVRVADDETAAFLESWMLRDYAALGYKVIRVPVLPPEERLNFVLKILSEQGLIKQLGDANR